MIKIGHKHPTGIAKARQNSKQRTDKVAVETVQRFMRIFFAQLSLKRAYPQNQLVSMSHDVFKYIGSFLGVNLSTYLADVSKRFATKRNQPNLLVQEI